MPSLAAFTHGVIEPASRFRFVQYRPLLEQMGWTVGHFPCRPPRPWNSPLSAQPWRALHQRAGWLARRWNRSRDIRGAGKFDAVFLVRDLLNGDPKWEARLLSQNPRVVFDLDDALYEGPGARQAEWMCRNAAWVTAGNETIAAWARGLTDRVTVLPTVVDVDSCKVATISPGTRRVGWCGSDRSIDQTLAPFLPLLARLQQKNDFEFVIMSSPCPVVNVPGLRWRFVEWNEADDRRLGDFFDVGIMPLPDLPFYRGKCGLKLLQYMACGLPVIASPVGINRELCGDGKRGFAATGDMDWEDALGKLLGNSKLRAELGQNGRVFCAAEYDLKKWAPVLSEILLRVAGTKSGISSV